MKNIMSEFLCCLFITAEARKIGLISQRLSAERVSLNWTSYEKQGIYGGPLTTKKKEVLKKYRGDWASSKNPWKFADATFNKIQLKYKMNYLIKEMSC